MRFLIITGMSGAGKTVALKTMEDMGYYCVDNLPVFLIPQFAELCFSADPDKKAALGIDTRNGNDLSLLKNTLKTVKENGISYEVLFLDCSDEVLIKRYKETRRQHPLSPTGRIEDGVKLERKAVSWLREEADYLIDTTKLISREFKVQLETLFSEDNNCYRNLVITVMSFGFKHGIPQDADLLFDVRFLPNPYYDETLKHRTGLDSEVSDFVKQGGKADEFIEKIKDLTDFLIPEYVREGKNHLVIAFGCTGGRHRSVAVAENVFNLLKNQDGFIKNIIHRDIYK